jgi:uncharacterized protein with ACT and thioredoxin-like domain
MNIDEIKTAIRQVETRIEDRAGKIEHIYTTISGLNAIWQEFKHHDDLEVIADNIEMVNAVQVMKEYRSMLEAQQHKDGNELRGLKEKLGEEATA